jgi:hypothetical protein
MFVINLDDDLSKAGAGFSRGLERAGHKYWKRVRVMSGGKLVWRYYYDNEKDRQRYAEDMHLRADRDKAKRQVRYWEQKGATGDHRSKAQFEADFPQLRDARKKLTELSEKYLQSILTWAEPPKIQVSDATLATHHKAMIDTYGDQDPSDLVGKPLSAMRAAELAFQRLPPIVKEHFSGVIPEIELATTNEDKHFSREANLVGYRDPKTGKIAINVEAAERIGAGRGARFGAGLAMVDAIVHEMAHAVSANMGREKAPPKGYTGPNWGDWEKFCREIGLQESAITKYAEGSLNERFSECFAAALLWPKQLALSSPRTYNWFRDFFGHDVLRPITNAIRPGFPPPDQRDLAKLASLRHERDKAVKAHDSAAILRIDAQLDSFVGVLDMADDDVRLKWWERQETKIQRILRQYREQLGNVPGQGDVYIHKDDKFYEISHNGRTMFLRIGKASAGEEFSGWTPTHPGKGFEDLVAAGKASQTILKPSEIKEVYDAEGNRLDPKSAWWYLLQDDKGFTTPRKTKQGKIIDNVNDLVSFENNSITEENAKALGRNILHKQLHYLARSGWRQWKTDPDKEEGDLIVQTMEPAEIDETEWRLRSGAFVHDRWTQTGDEIKEQLKRTEDPEKRKELAREYLKVQPGAEFVVVRDAKGRVLYRMPKLESPAPGDPPLPVMNELRYFNRNPDGTETEVRVDRGSDGRFYLANPLWRQLLTPLGDPINSSADLELKCRQAANERRRAWVSIRTNAGGDTPHYYHVQLEYDGKGQPKILGDEWKLRLGKETPRLDDLFDGSKGIPKVKAEKIKKPKTARPKKGAAALPEVRVGTAILNVSGPELGRLEDREVVVQLMRVLPAKKKGETESPPGWDRMPIGVTEELPYPGFADDKASAKLSTKEKGFVEQGLLPEWYWGTADQREWFRKIFLPEYEKWERTKDANINEALPDRYVFAAVEGQGFPGKQFIRYGSKGLKKDLRSSYTITNPDPLQHDVLMYMHREVNPATGEIKHQEMRILLPVDGSVDPLKISNVSGVSIGKDGVIRATTTGFARLREQLGAISLTGDADDYLQQRADEMRQAEFAARDQHHLIDVEDLDPGRLHDLGVDNIKKETAPGRPFVLGQHQKEVVQKTIENGGRQYIMHYMGTGKTVSAVALAETLKVIDKLPLKEVSEEAKKLGRAPAKQAKRILIVAPLNTVEQWREAVTTFTHGRAAVVGAGKSMIPVDEYDGNDQLVIVGPQYFQLHAKELRKLGFDYVVVDEAHQGFKKEGAERLKELKEWNDDLSGLVFMSGTPMTISVSDLFEPIKMLSNGEVWGDKTQKELEEEYLEASSVPRELGSKKAGPKIQVKPAKRAELAAILTRWCHVALSRDVKDKMIPMTQLDENKYSEMTGTQSALYSMYMALLGDDDKAKLSGSAGVLSMDEAAALEGDAKAALKNAMSIANCPAYKPASDAPFVKTVREVPSADGKKTKKEPVDWATFDPDWLMNREDVRDVKIRKRLAGRWPTVEEIGDATAALYDVHFRHVLGQSYYEIAGTKIDPKGEVWKRIAKKEGGKWTRTAEWPRNVANPDAGPVGIRCRGWDEDIPVDGAEYDRAVKVQRDYKRAMTGDIPAYINVDDAFAKIGKALVPDPEKVLLAVAKNYGISSEEGARKALAMRDRDYVHHDTVTYGHISVKEGETWFSDKRGSKHLPFRPEDWDVEAGRPRSAGGFEAVRDGDTVEIPAKLLPKPKIGDPPEGLTREEKAAWKAEQLAEWIPPTVRYDASQGEQGGKVAVVTDDEDEVTIWVPKKDISSIARSIFDPGLREERDKFDVAMVVGNAKAETLRLKMEEFHDGSGPGPHGERQLVIFGNSILESCHAATSTLRLMGFRDVNEALPGSPHYDPNDPNPMGNGKYFVTYIGKGYIGDRDLNSEIFKKKKDKKTNRDTQMSMFTARCVEGKAWYAYDPETGGTKKHDRIEMSQWEPEARVKVKKQFGIDAPEAYYTDPMTGEQKYFYGTKESADLLREMVKIGHPASYEAPKGSKPEEVKAGKEKAAKKAAQLVALQQKYEAIVAKHATITPPLTQQQRNVFDNCIAVVASDAANVGLNWGNATEVVNYDTLASPMAEWQRITRAARMLDPALKDELTAKKGDKLANGKIADKDGAVKQLLDMELDIFKPVPQAQVGGELIGVRVGDDDSPRVKMTFTETLERVEAYCAEQASKASKQAMIDEWQLLANRAKAARALGIDRMMAELQSFKTTRKPGSNENLLSFNRFGEYTRPDSGTYTGTTMIEEPISALREAVTRLPLDAQRQLAETGFAVKDGGIDAVQLYMSIRVQQIMDKVNTLQTEYAKRMRSASGGSVIQDSDVMKAVIDSLQPEERAILKNMKSLVSVTRMGVSGMVPQAAKIQVVTGYDANGAPVLEERNQFTGYEKQAPIEPEANRRAVGRARNVIMEQVQSDIQNLMPVRTELDYVTVTATDAGRTSIMAKSDKLVLRLW